MKIPTLTALFPLLTLAFAAPAASDPDLFFWPTSLEEARQASSTTGRPLIVYVKDSV